MVEPLYSSEESTIFYYFSVKDEIIPFNLFILAVETKHYIPHR